MIEFQMRLNHATQTTGIEAESNEYQNALLYTHITFNPHLAFIKIDTYTVNL